MQYVAEACLGCCPACLPLLGIHIHNHIRSCKLTFCVNDRNVAVKVVSRRRRHRRFVALRRFKSHQQHHQTELN